jgi:hypothetical protein
MKAGSYDLHAVCVSLYPLSTFEWQNRLDMYIMAPEPISSAPFINSFHQPVCLYAPIVARQRLGKTLHIVARQRLGKNRYSRNEYIRNNRRIVGCVVTFAARVV